MQRIVWYLCAGALCLSVLSSPLASQEPTYPVRPVPTSTKSPAMAGFLEYMVPWVGYAYAGDAGRGTVPNVVRLGGLVLFAAGWKAEGDWLFFLPLNEDADVECTVVCQVGLATVIGGTIWAIAGAVDTARDGNALVRAVRNVSLQPSPFGGMSIGLRLRH